MRIFTHYIKSIISICIFSFSFLTFPATIIFDMDGVLVTKSRFSVAWQIGLANFIGFYNPFSLDKKFFEFLDRLEPRKANTPPAAYQNMLLPQIMCDWLSGAKTNEEIRTILHHGLEKHNSLFSTYAQKRIIAALTEFTFTPERFSEAMIPVKGANKLIKRCAKSIDKNGHKNRIFILSNWDSESFGYIKKKKKIAKLFSYCEDVIISGDVHVIKPDPTIFELLLTKYSIDPTKEPVVFIDDTPINIKAASDLGIHGILCENLNIKAVKKELKQLGAIS
jgi:FMN phosphatase YigB (HAD superfamily)